MQQFATTGPTGLRKQQRKQQDQTGPTSVPLTFSGFTSRWMMRLAWHCSSRSMRCKGSSQCTAASSSCLLRHAWWLPLQPATNNQTSSEPLPAPAVCSTAAHLPSSDPPRSSHLQARLPTCPVGCRLQHRSSAFPFQPHHTSALPFQPLPAAAPSPHNPEPPLTWATAPCNRSPALPYSPPAWLHV